MEEKTKKEWKNDNYSNYITIQNKFFNFNFCDSMDYLESVKKDQYFSHLKDIALGISVAKKESTIRQVVSSAIIILKICNDGYGDSSHKDGFSKEKAKRYINQCIEIIYGIMAGPEDV